ncbi:Coenzyme F420 hydrogenase/dehydrogenase, beta subunit C-terminal domain [Chloroflexota bacterium]
MNTVKTVESIVKDGLCTGCGTCFAVCAPAAIKVVRSDRFGTFTPEIDKNSCTSCGICFQVCPGHSVNYEQLNNQLFGTVPSDNVLGNYLQCYSGHATDDAIRRNSTSGGMITAILVTALEAGIIDGALVTGMNSDNPLESRPFIARTREEIISACGSKYAPASANIALKEIMESEGKYAVVGLPCQISGIRKAESLYKNLSEKIVLHLGLMCIQSQNFRAVQFLLWMRGINEQDVISFDYRGAGWPGGATITLKDGREEFIGLLDYRAIYDISFFPFRCKLCTDPENEFADICFGDCFLPEFLSGDKLGTSGIIVRNQKGQDFLVDMATRGIISLNEISSDKIGYSQEYFHLKKGTFKLYRALTRILRHKLPQYNTGLSRLRPLDFIEWGKHLVAQFLSSKRLLWPLVLPYIGFMRFLAVTTGRILRFLRLNKLLLFLKGYQLPD